MGVRSKDIDYVVEAPSYEAMVAWIQERGSIFLEQPEYFTVRAHITGKQPADFVLARKEGKYTDGRRPDHVEAGTLLDDLSRRDFTVNAIAYNEETDEYIDPFDGRGDLQRNVLRCVGTARDRFSEDALRLLRALRFKITKGFELDTAVWECLHSSILADLLRDNVSTERKREELQRCFAHSTLDTLDALRHFPLVEQACFGDGRIRLLPTQREI